MVERMLGLFHISLTEEHLAWILQIAVLALEEKENITIALDSGADITLPSLGGDPVRLMVHTDTLMSVAARLQSVSNALKQQMSILDGQRRGLPMVLSVVWLRLRGICRKLERQEQAALLLAKTLQTAASQYRDAEKAACAFAE